MKNFIIVKKYFCIIMATVMLFASLCPCVSFAAFNKNKANTIAAGTTLDNIKAKSYALAHLDSKNGIVMQSENADEHFTVGNLVKLMTLYLAFESIDSGKTTLKSAVKVSKKAQQISNGRARVFLDAGKGEIITVEDAILAISINGANDACYALAEHLSGADEAAFVKMMNAKAVELGLTNTNYLDSTGILIIDDGQYSSARDVCKLSLELVRKYPQVTEYTKQDTQMFHHTSTGQPDTQMITSNFLATMNICKGADGLICGYSNKDLYAQAGTAIVDGERTVAVVIGEKTAEDRAGELKFLLNYGMTNFNMKNVVSKDTYVRMVKIKNGKSMKIKSCTGSSFEYLDNVSEKAVVEPTIKIDAEIKAPIEKGQVLGQITYFKKYKDANDEEIQEEIGSIDLVAAESMDKCNWFTRLVRKILNLFGLGDY